jgi:hypothetical protein
MLGCTSYTVNSPFGPYRKEARWLSGGRLGGAL